MVQQPSNMGLFLEFLPNPAGEEEGLGHAGIQTYRNDPYSGTARETGQNSRDVARELPVRISYDLLEVPRTEIPAIDSLQSTIETCLAESKGKEKETAFFRQALKVVSQPSLKILRIADFNTTGARGPSVAGTPFHSLVKASGVSVKENVASGGSFGIGKNAVFAVSDLQTVFYSTVYEESGAKNFLAQGKAILVSHHGADGIPRRQVGYWGLPGFREIANRADAPEWLRRAETGTSVFVLGFRETPDWQHRIMYSLIQNFFPAIHNGEMEFTLDEGKYDIGGLTLASFFENPGVLGAARANDREQEFELSRNLYRCLVSPEAKEQIVTLPELGLVQIRVLVQEKLPKKVFIVRNGMIITDSLEHFGDKFARFAMYRDFVAVVTPLDTSGSAFLKKLEDPRHRELSAEGLPDAASREAAKNAMKRLARKVRDTIKSYTLSQFENEVSADEMSRYFASGTEPSSAGKTSDQEDPQTIRYKVEPPKERPRARGAAEGGGQPGSGGGGGDPGPRPGPGPRPRPPAPDPKPRAGGPGGPGPLRAITLRDVRNTKARGSGRSRTIFFTPTESGIADIAVLATGLNLSEDLVVVSASGAEVSGGRVRRRIAADERIRIEVEFDDEYEGPIDVRVKITAEVEEPHEN